MQFSKKPCLVSSIRLVLTSSTMLLDFSELLSNAEYLAGASKLILIGSENIDFMSLFHNVSIYLYQW